MEKKNYHYIATYIYCDLDCSLAAYDIYSMQSGKTIYREIEKESINSFLEGKNNIIKLLESGSILQISHSDKGAKIQIGNLLKKPYSNVEKFNKYGEVIDDNVSVTLEKLDKEMGNVVYSNKSGYQKTIGGLYEQRFNIGNFSRRNG